jgi:hypothetical protein
MKGGRGRAGGGETTLSGGGGDVLVCGFLLCGICFCDYIGYGVMYVSVRVVHL